MCLNIVLEVCDGQSEEVEVGYKWFYTPTNTTEVRGGFFSEDIHTTNKWLSGKNRYPNLPMQEVVDHLGYEPGFHIFKTLKGAKAHRLFMNVASEDGYHIRKVSYKGVLAIGEEFAYPYPEVATVIVAKHMMIGEIVK